MEENINYQVNFGISKIWLDELFPFHFAIDEWGGIIDHGPLLPKAFKDLELNMGVDNFLEYDDIEEGEDKEISPESMQTQIGKRITMIGKMAPLKLTGELRYFEGPKYYIFLGTPIIQKANQLTRYGIQLEDLPLSDPCRNYIQLADQNSPEVE